MSQTLYYILWACKGNQNLNSVCCLNGAGAHHSSYTNWSASPRILLPSLSQLGLVKHTLIFTWMLWIKLKCSRSSCFETSTLTPESYPQPCFFSFLAPVEENQKQLKLYSSMNIKLSVNLFK